MRILLPSLVLLAATTTLTSCGNDDPAVDKYANDFDVKPCTTRPAETAGITDGGQTLCFGTEATIPAEKTLGGEGVVRMSVNSLERADDALISTDVAPFVDNVDPDSQDLWFVRGSAQIVEEETPDALTGEIGGYSPFGFSMGVGETGKNQGTTGPAPTVGSCNDGYFKEGAGTGARLRGCRWALVAQDDVPQVARFNDTVEDGRGISYIGSPLYWAAE